MYTNPAAYPPLEHSSRILAGEGWDVLFLGTGSFGADALEFPPHPRIRVRRLAYRAPGILQKAHYARFAAWCLGTAFLFRPGWVYASDPLACPIGLILKGLGFRVLYHEHDSPPMLQQGAMPKGEDPLPYFQRLVLKTRRALAQQADLCVLPNAQRLEVFRAQTGRSGPTLCVWNCPRREEVLGNRDFTKDQYLLHYHGNVGPELVPLALVEALKRIPRLHLTIIGYATRGSETYPETLKNVADQCGIENRVHICPPEPRSRLLEAARRAAIGISLMPMGAENLNLCAMTGASNKAFDYMACGLALLVSDLPDWRKMFVEPGYGLACNPSDPTSIAAALRWFAAHPDETRAMGERARQRILSGWNYEAQFAPVQRILNQTTGDALRIGGTTL